MWNENIVYTFFVINCSETAHLLSLEQIGGITALKTLGSLMPPTGCCLPTQEFQPLVCCTWFYPRGDINKLLLNFHVNRVKMNRLDGSSKQEEEKNGADISSGQPAVCRQATGGIRRRSVYMCK